MGMELCYQVKIKGVGCTWIDFQFHTSTKITKAVLRTKGTEERIKVLREMTPVNEETLDDIRKYLNSPDITLTEI